MMSASAEHNSNTIVVELRDQGKASGDTSKAQKKIINQTKKKQKDHDDDVQLQDQAYNEWNFWHLELRPQTLEEPL